MKLTAKLLQFVCLSAGVLAAATAGAQYLPLTGGTLTGPLTGPEINNVISPCSQAGATADQQINNAIAALHGSPGTVDASCYGGSVQSIAGTVTIPANVILRGSLATRYQPSSAALSGASGAMFSLEDNSHVSDIWVDMSTLTANTFTGQVFSFIGSYYPFNLNNQRVFPTSTTLERFVINASTQTAAGVGIYMTGSNESSSPSAQTVSNVSIRHGYIAGLLYQIELYTTGGWINGNTFEDIGLEQTAAGCGFYWFAADNQTGNGIYGNMFTNINYEDNGGVAGAYGICSSGIGTISGNTWWNSNIWDAPVPVNFTNSATQRNVFEGITNGPWPTGKGNYNNYFDPVTTGKMTWSGEIDATIFNLSGLGSYGSQGKEILGPWGSASTSVFPLAPGGAVVAAYTSGGYAPIQASVFQTEGGDFAERMRADQRKEPLEPGDVLVITNDNNNDVRKSSEPYSPMVAGIYATKPGVLGSRDSVSKSRNNVPMAIIGVVPTKVTAENGPIRKGDLLVTSSLRGYAMKGTDRSRMLGAVMGKAMGSLDSGTGVIEVLVTLQ